MVSLDQGNGASTGHRPDSAATSLIPAIPHVESELLPGETVGQRYRVRKLLGQGGMGRVYAASDVLLGRGVALKVVRRELVGAAGSERFADEARLLAALNHPHIVQLHDAGVHRGLPYLALEHVEGETLQRRGKTTSLDEALRIARAIADALSHAHQRGILHCDLKPSNVLIGRDGRLRVVDFGLARRAAEAASSEGTGEGEGTPEWMAPEQWRGGPLTDRVDVWALAVLFVDLIGEGDPFGPRDAGRRARVLDTAIEPRLPSRADLPAHLLELVRRSLSREPADRPSVHQWCHGLEAALAGRDAPLSLEGPYRGLAAFEEQHARDFFGRDAEIDAFLERLRGAPLLPIVGASGAGKSSFLFAGVIPRLRARRTWNVISLRPGARPIEALARRLLAAGQLGESMEGSTLGSDSTSQAGNSLDENGGLRALTRELSATPTLLAERLTSVTPPGEQLLLAIDQLEEVFTHGASEEEVRALLAMLIATADGARDELRVVVTVRDDFLGRLAGLRELFVMKPLGAQDLRRAITGPLQRTGHSFDDPQLVDDMLSELGSSATSSGATSAGSLTASELPLLQFACRALWDERDTNKRLLLRAVYRRIGGVAGALARHADGVIDELPPAERGLARQTFLRLVVGSARRAVPRETLAEELRGSSPVIDRLVAARLLVQRTSTDEVTVVEIAHEALLLRWSRLRNWLDETGEERRLLHELEEASALWRKRGARPEETWRSAEIAATRHRLLALGLRAPPEGEAFLAAGERQHQLTRRKSRRRWALAGLAGAAVTLLSVLLAGEFRRQQLAAEKQTEALRLAGGNLGKVELAFAPFDWENGRAVAADVATLPDLSWKLFAAAPDDMHRPGDEVPAELVRRLGSDLESGARVDRAELPGGTAFLRIDGRGRRGERCPPSWIRLQALPGYATRNAPGARLVLPVPTCAASDAGMVEIPAGPFIYGGPGEPSTPYEDHLTPEAVVELPSFAIDRTELSNAQFEPFARMRQLTGYAIPDYPRLPLFVDAGNPERPLAGVDGFEAEAICRFWGKRLPGEHEWVKAARGGLVIDGKPNPAPRRLYPWGIKAANCSNDAGLEDGFAWMAPVDALPCGASPYGVLNLAGNVAEWISRDGQTDRAVNPLWVLRGGEADAPRQLAQSTTTYRNEREGRQFHLGVGLRCAIGGPL